MKYKTTLNILGYIMQSKISKVFQIYKTLNYTIRLVGYGTYNDDKSTQLIISATYTSFPSLALLELQNIMPSNIKSQFLKPLAVSKKSMNCSG